MTTSSQPSVLTESELAALRALGGNEPTDVSDAMRACLAAKGMLQDAGGTLTPAGKHAIHIGEPGTVPGLDN